MSFLEEDDHSRTILHFDLDCFYAQVETILDPSLVDKPVGVQQKNIVVTCNYLARQKGVTKCCFISDAKKICPELVLVNGEDLAKYRKFSQQVFDIISDEVKSYQCPIEKLGLDENFVDVTNLVAARLKGSTSNPQVSGHTFGSCSTDSSTCQGCNCRQNLAIGSLIAQELRSLLFKKLCLTSSCGIGHNKLLAKLVGATHKPNMQTTIFPWSCNELMMSLPSARAIPGIGHSTFKILDSKGLGSVKSLQDVSLDFIGGFLDSSVAQRIKQLTFGIDPNPVKMSGPAISIGLEDRFKGITTKVECEEKLLWLIGRLSKLLREDGRLPQVLKISVRDCLKDKGSFHKVSRQTKISPSLFNSLRESETLDPASQKSLLSTSVSLLAKMVEFNHPYHLTLLGIAVTDFISANKNGSIQSFFNGATASQSSTSRLQESSRSTHFDVESNAKLSKDESAKHFGKETCSSPSLEDQKLSEKETCSKRKADRDDFSLPNDWDPDVFKSLPPELQKELLASNQSPSPVPKKPKVGNNILNYFGKKSS